MNSNDILVYKLFNKKKRKYRVRNNQRKRNKRNLSDISDNVEQYLDNYKHSNFSFHLRNLILSLPRKYMCVVCNVFNNWAAGHVLPSRIKVLPLRRMKMACLWVHM